MFLGGELYAALRVKEAVVQLIRELGITIN
jgi:hypothetical protein